MPIYEFYCADCHTIFHFLARVVDTTRRPACPRCGRPELERKVSAFAISKGRSDGAEGAEPDVDDERMERVMAELAREAETLSEDDPKGMAQMMRKLYDATGMKLTAGMEEALRRLEAGEDPDRIEEELGDAFDEDDLFAGDEAATGGGGRLARLRRRLTAPRVDETLYEL